jgi:hypothetical protein
MNDVNEKSRHKRDFLLWTGPELNRRHTAFQAVALPTELPVRKFLDLAFKIFRVKC